MVDNNDKIYFKLQEKSFLTSIFVEAKTKKLSQKPFYASLNAIDELHRYRVKPVIYIYIFFSNLENSSPFFFLTFVD